MVKNDFNNLMRAIVVADVLGLVAVIAMWAFLFGPGWLLGLQRLASFLG